MEKAKQINLKLDADQQEKLEALLKRHRATGLKLTIADLARQAINRLLDEEEPFAIDKHEKRTLRTITG
jgi:hypothetical protein